MVLLPSATDYVALRGRFRWHIPARYNIAIDACDRWAVADPTRVAVLFGHADGSIERLTYGQLREASSRFANALMAHGVGFGDRVAILLDQAPQVAIALLAVFRLGAIAVPLDPALTDAAHHRALADVGARVVVSDGDHLQRLPAETTSSMPMLRIGVDRVIDGAFGFDDLVAAGAARCLCADTSPDDAALVMFEPDAPAGVVHAHCVLLGQIPGVQLIHDLAPKPMDRFWTPLAWTSICGLLDVLLPGLKLGVAVVGWRREAPERDAAWLRTLEVANVVLPVQAIGDLRSICATAGARRPRLRSIGVHGGALCGDARAWALADLGAALNPYYRSPQSNVVLASCHAIGAARAHCVGLPVFGHDVAVLRSDGARANVGEVGRLAVRRPDPAATIGHWNPADATICDDAQPWLLTGDTALCDDGDYLRINPDASA